MADNFSPSVTFVAKQRIEFCPRINVANYISETFLIYIIISFSMENLYNLKGKTAWIAGGKRIGKKVAEVLAQHGANLILSYKNSKKEAEETKKSVKKYGIKTLVIQVDISDKSSVINGINKIKKLFNKIDILVLMASIF